MHPLAPKLGPNEAGDKLGKDPLWENFARKIQHHPDVKLFLIAKQGGKCPVCSRGVGQDDTVHHVSYLFRCLYEHQVDVMASTGKRAKKLVKAPPCSGCPNLSRCASMLVIVHDRCHHLIHAAP
ncbi:hypothetical protein [Pseudomonas amygdali]|uniref:hypothetical protein n=1 Tax=Pseudomonas amygdali TaxID=47877 RepID=UPI0005C7B845|nr:hypothetical protein [Pseudomonas amygdali]